MKFILNIVALIGVLACVLGVIGIATGVFGVNLFNLSRDFGYSLVRISGITLATVLIIAILTRRAPNK